MLVLLQAVEGDPYRAVEHAVVKLANAVAGNNEKEIWENFEDFKEKLYTTQLFRIEQQFPANSRTLKRVLETRAKEGLETRQKFIIAANIARGMAHVSESGLVHRDIKPANIIVGEDGRVRVGDLGLSISPEDEAEFDTPLAGVIRMLEKHLGLSPMTPGYFPTQAYQNYDFSMGSDRRRDFIAFWITVLPLFGIDPFKKEALQLQLPSGRTIQVRDPKSQAEILAEMQANDQIPPIVKQFFWDPRIGIKMDFKDFKGDQGRGRQDSAALWYAIADAFDRFSASSSAKADKAPLVFIPGEMDTQRTLTVLSRPAPPAIPAADTDRPAPGLGQGAPASPAGARLAGDTTVKMKELSQQTIEENQRLLRSLIQINEDSGWDFSLENRDIKSEYLMRGQYNGLVWTASDADGNIDGYAWVTLVDPGSADYYLMAVKEDRQGVGVGRQLRSAVLTYLNENNIRQIGLTIQANNERSLRFFDELITSGEARLTDARLEVPERDFSLRRENSTLITFRDQIAASAGFKGRFDLNMAVIYATLTLAPPGVRETAGSRLAAMTPDQEASLNRGLDALNDFYQSGTNESEVETLREFERLHIGFPPTLVPLIEYLSDRSRGKTQVNFVEKHVNEMNKLLKSFDPAPVIRVDLKEPRPFTLQGPGPSSGARLSDLKSVLGEKLKTGLERLNGNRPLHVIEVRQRTVSGDDFLKAANGMEAELKEISKTDPDAYTAFVIERPITDGIEYRIVVDKASLFLGNAYALLNGSVNVNDKVSFLLSVRTHTKDRSVHVEDVLLSPELRGQGLASEAFAGLAEFLERRYNGWTVSVIAAEEQTKGRIPENFIPYQMAKYFD
ncbi:MAG TPA: N-acetyltransferase, partial [Candidatus Omnitrophota bacterium]|nr:N-acetyltransferase [Candidatus Omnitrophota bacterium]